MRISLNFCAFYLEAFGSKWCKKGKFVKKNYFEYTDQFFPAIFSVPKVPSHFMFFVLDQFSIYIDFKRLCILRRFPMAISININKFIFKLLYHKFIEKLCFFLETCFFHVSWPGNPKMQKVSVPRSGILIFGNYV